MQNPTNAGGSQTQLLGSATVVSECTRVVLFNQSLSLGSDESRATLFGLQGFYKNVVLPRKHAVLTRETPDVPFKYNYRVHGGGFDLVIYVRNSDNLPVGFTEFNQVQGETRNMNISLELSYETEISKAAFTDLASVSQLKIANLTPILIGEEPYQYVSASKLLTEKVEPKSSYSIHVDDLDSGKAILTTTGGVLGDNVYKCGILKNKNFDPHNIGFTGYSFCKTEDDIEVLGWKQGEDGALMYSIYSMTKTNLFGNPLAYTRDHLVHKEILNGAGYCIVSDPNESKEDISKPHRIVNAAGRYILVDVGGDMKAYDVYTDRYVDSKYFIVDERAYKTGLVNIEGTGSYNNYVLACPDILNLYVDVPKLLVKNLKIYRKVGSWFILHHKFSSESDLYICASPVSTVYVTKNDLDKILFINETSMAIKEDNYYVLYTGHGVTYYSERARNLTESGLLENVDMAGVDNFLFNKGGSRDSEYQEYYSKGLIEVISSTSPLHTTTFNRYRRNSYPLGIDGVPNIIGACDGLLFYMNGRLINYL